MGALTTNRKRGDELFSLNRTNLSPLSNRSTSNKKQRLISDITSSTTSKSHFRNNTSIIYRYPVAAPPFRRKVHAPCKGGGKLGFPAGSGGQKVPVSTPPLLSMWDLTKYWRMRHLAFDTLRYHVKEEQKHEEIEVVDLEEDEEHKIENGLGEGEEGDDLFVISAENFRDGESGGNTEAVNDLDVEMVEEKPEVISSSVVDLEEKNSLDMKELALGLEEMSEPLYQKLLQCVERRSPRLKELGFQIEMERQGLSSLQLIRSVTKKKEEVQVVDLEPPLIDLTDEEERIVSRAFHAKWNAVLVFHENSNISITGRIMQCLTPGSWLNDEVINLYLDLLKERELREPKRFLKCHYFNTFFYKKLICAGKGYDYKSVRRWTTHKKLGYNLIDCDKIFVPVHKEIHWCLAVISTKDKKFQYLDSLGGVDNRVLKILAKYITDEVKDKMGKELDTSLWSQEHVDDLPLQENGSDCGVFMIKYIDYCSQNRLLTFKQENMPYFRRKTALEILRKRCE